MSGYDYLGNNGINNLYSDPSWQQYWLYSQMLNSQNNSTVNNNAENNNIAFKGQSVPTSDIGTVTTAGALTNANYNTESKNGNHTAAWLTLGVGTIGAAACILAGRGKTSGAKGFLNQVKTGAQTLFKRGAQQGSKISVRTINNKNIIAIPNKGRGIPVHGSTTGEVVQKAKTLGFTVNENLALTDEAAHLKSTHFKFNFGSGKAKEYTGVFRDGEIVSLKDAKGKKYDLDNLPDKLQTRIESIKSSINTTKQAQDVTLFDTVYYQKLDDASWAQYISNSSKDPNLNGLRNVITNRYTLNDDAVTAACADSKVANVLKELKEGKFDSWDIASGTWKPANSKTFWEKIGLSSAKYNGAVTGKNWDNNLEFIIKDSKIAGLSSNGGGTIDIRPGSNKYEALKVDFPDLFNEVLNHQAEYTGDIVRIMK